ncbi:hypothetical protein OIV83_001353 [Microbotryomycetes sp. JL201]|nr:hypothetical protein OIV83_001353 [Microbotryomycetes sp. JL201]
MALGKHDRASAPPLRNSVRQVQTSRDRVALPTSNKAAGMDNKASESRVDSQDAQMALPEPAVNATQLSSSPPTATAHKDDDDDDDRDQDAQRQTQSGDADPSVQHLKAIFPDQTDDVLEAVLAANGGDLQRATEQLLQMSDPNYKQDAAAIAQAQQDEDYARALMLEEQQSAHRQRQQQDQERTPLSSGGLTYTPYTPRRRVTNSTSGQLRQQPHADARGSGGSGPGNSLHSDATDSQQSQQTQPRDELDQLSEQFSKLAEQGKRQFGVFLGKAREQVGKLNEAIEKQNNVTSNPPVPPAKEHATEPPRSSSPASAPKTSVVPEPLPKPSASAPREAELSTSSPVAPSGRSDSKPDFSKIGLLPRQSVSLLDQKNRKNDKDDDDDDDELEYVKSPFDDD